jgi:hypothetical protein
MIRWGHGSVQFEHKLGKWIEREELGLGRSLDSFEVAHK